MIYIRNLKVFNCSINKSFHWSKLPKLKEKLNTEYFNFPSYANLRYADLRYVDLCYADLSYADLRYADLRYADLSCADLRYADLRYADLSCADLSYARLQPINGKEIIIKDFMTVQGLGSCNRKIHILKTNIGIVLMCDCFYGTEKEFKKKVKETYAGTNYEKEYLEMLKLARIRFSREIE